MPRYTDPTTGRTISAEEPLNDTELEEAFGHGDTSTAGQRVGQYLTHKGSEFVGALQGVGKDVQNLVTGQPYGTGFPGQRGALETVGDVATTAAPLVAPELTAAGLAVGTGARALGASETDADIANTATQLAGGLGGAAVGAGRAVSRAPAALRAAAQAKYGEAAAGAGSKLITAADPFVQSLSDALESPLTHPVERAMATPLLNKVTAPGSPGLSYADLDNALAGLTKMRKGSYVRQLIDEAAQGLLEGTPAGEARAAAKGMYKSLKTKPFRVGGQLAFGVAGGTAAAHDLAQGNYKRAGLTLAGTALAGQGLKGLTGRGLAAAAGGAAGPLARTAVAVGGPAARAREFEATPPEAATAPEEAAPEESPQPTVPAVPRGPYGRELAAVSSLVGVPVSLLQSVMSQESQGDPNAISHPAPDQIQTPAHGLMQITPGTFAGVQKEASALLGRTAQLGNPLDNMVAGGLLWRKYLDRTNGDVGLASKMYHGGENPAAWGPHTEQYSRDILSRFASRVGG